jgi:hypothetical protein
MHADAVEQRVVQEFQWLSGNKKFALEPGAWTVLAGIVAVEGDEVRGAQQGSVLAWALGWVGFGGQGPRLI